MKRAIVGVAAAFAAWTAFRVWRMRSAAPTLPLADAVRMAVKNPLTGPGELERNAKLAVLP